MFDAETTLLEVLIYFKSLLFVAMIYYVAATPFALSFLLDVVEI